MTQPIPPGLLPEGLSDRLPPAAEASARMVRSLVDTISAYGYSQVTPPLAEFEETLVSRMKSARAQDLMRAVDPVSQRTLALRPDITAQVGRIAATRLAAAARPLRLCYAGPVLRIAANQLRPERERMQVGAELIGSDSVAAATEVVGVAIEALQAAGVTGITVDFTLPDLIDTLAASAMPLERDAKKWEPVFREKSRDQKAAADINQVRAALDAKDAGALARLGTDAAAYLPLIAATGPFHAAMERLEAIDADVGRGAVASRIAGLRAIAKPIGWDITLTLDPTERHGFDYQSWFGFSIFADGYVGEIGRGGSYAITRGDGSEEPATGFSLYPDPLIDAGHNAAAPRLLFLPIGTDPERAKALRADGWRTVAALSVTDDGAALGCGHWLDGDAVRAF